MVAVTVYMVVVVGETVTDGPTKIPGVHTLVKLPTFDNTALFPEQITLGVATGLIIGLTVFTVIDAVPEQPYPLTVTV